MTNVSSSPLSSLSAAIPPLQYTANFLFCLNRLLVSDSGERPSSSAEISSKKRSGKAEGGSGRAGREAQGDPARQGASGIGAQGLELCGFGYFNPKGRVPSHVLYIVTTIYNCVVISINIGNVCLSLIHI